MQHVGKALSPNVGIAFGDAMVMFVSVLQPQKAYFPICVMVLGKQIFFNDEQLEKASHSIIDSEFENVMLVSDSHNRKAFFPMVVMEFGNVIVLSDEHP